MPRFGCELRRWSDRRTGLLIFLGLLFTYSFIGPGYGVLNPNAVSRMGLAYAIIDRHSLAIDDFVPFTVDKAETGSGFFLDKAPGLSFMALPVVAATNALMRLAHIDPAPIAGGELTRAEAFDTYLSCIFTSALFTALAAFFFHRLARRLGFSSPASVLATLGFALATPAMGWATQFFGHAVAGSSLFIAFALVVEATMLQTERRVALLESFAAGGLLGWSVVAEYTSAPAALVIGLFALWRVSEIADRAARRLVAGGVAGAIIAFIPLLIYNRLAFGSPFHVGYQSVVGFAGMKQGLLGISAPRLDVLVDLLFASRRGILWISPFLILSPIAYAAAFRRFGIKMGTLLLAIPAIYLAINSGYHYWDGGASTGPRHITPALAFAAFAFLPLWDTARGVLRGLLGALTAISAIVSFACANVTMMAFERLSNPLTELIFPRLVRGMVHNALIYLGGGYVGGRALMTLLALPFLWLLAALIAGSFRRQVTQ